MNRESGSALIDYVIPTAVVGLVVGLALYHLVSSGSLLSFLSRSANINSINYSTGKAVIGVSSNSSDNTGINGDEDHGIQPGSLGGTPGNPVYQCTNGVCIVDYGTFILTGIPESDELIIIGGGRAYEPPGGGGKITTTTSFDD